MGVHPQEQILGAREPLTQKTISGSVLSMVIVRNTVDVARFNPNAVLPFELRPQDFQMAMQDVYDFSWKRASLGMASRG